MAAILHLLILSVLCVYSPSNIESVPSSVGIMRDSSSFQHPILTVPEKFTKLFLYTHEIRFLNKIKIQVTQRLLIVAYSLIYRYFCLPDWKLHVIPGLIFPDVQQKKLFFQTSVSFGSCICTQSYPSGLPLLLHLKSSGQDGHSSEILTILNKDQKIVLIDDHLNLLRWRKLILW